MYAVSTVRTWRQSTAEHVYGGVRYVDAGTGHWIEISADADVSDSASLGAFAIDGDGEE